ncbi:MAG: Ohr family peroxiredoxin [Acidobacteriota bacterium]
MNHIQKVLYTAKAHTTGGRDGGASATDDGRLQVTLAQPGGHGTGTNPEQLFAVGWSACFLSAAKLAAAKRRIALPENVAIDTEVDLGTDGPAFLLAARLDLSLPGLDQQTAEAILDDASHMCPYSLATKGNIDVKYSVSVSARANEPQHA